MLLDHCSDLRTNGAERFVFINTDDAMSFANGFINRFLIKWTDGTKVHHFNTNAMFGFKNFSRFQACKNSAAVAYESNVCAFAFYIGYSKRDKELTVW